VEWYQGEYRKFCLFESTQWSGINEEGNQYGNEPTHINQKNTGLLQQELF